MGRKAVGKKGKRTDILQAAFNCFLKNGYDGTSIREIMKEAKAEVGLFYYYFDGKDDCFRQAQELFAQEYLCGMDAIVESAKIDNFRVLSHLFNELIRIMGDVQSKYSKNLHPSVLGAMRDMLLTRFAPYVKQVLEELVRKGANPQMDLDVAAQFLTYGVGGILTRHPSKDVYYSVEVRKCFNAIMGLSPEESMAMQPLYATQEDAGEILLLLAKQSKSIDGASMIAHMEQEEVLCCKGTSGIDGCVVFDKAMGEILALCTRKTPCEKLIQDVLSTTAGADIIYYNKEKERK